MQNLLRQIDRYIIYVYKCKPPMKRPHFITYIFLIIIYTNKLDYNINITIYFLL